MGIAVQGPPKTRPHQTAEFRSEVTVEKHSTSENGTATAILAVWALHGPVDCECISVQIEVIARLQQRFLELFARQYPEGDEVNDLIWPVCASKNLSAMVKFEPMFDDGSIWSNATTARGRITVIIGFDGVARAFQGLVAGADPNPGSAEWKTYRRYSVMAVGVFLQNSHKPPTALIERAFSLTAMGRCSQLRAK
jgi:hypothetical protein